MEERTLGNSGLAVSPIGLGLAALGRPGYINLGHAGDLNQNYDVEVMENHAHAVLDAAWETGVRYFDAARSYGKAEQFLASWLKTRHIAPDSVTVGSKWGYIYTAEWQVEAAAHEVKEHSLSVLRGQQQESRELLGDHLDLYQIHSATLKSGVLQNEAVLDELARLRQGGLKIGLSLSGTGQAETLYRALEVTRDGQLLFDSVQATWNLLERSAEAALKAAHEAGIGVIIKEALANGRLTPRNQAATFREQRDLLERLALEQQTTIDALALASVLAQPWVDVVLSGAATVEHLRSNVKAVNITWSSELMEQLDPLLEPTERYWTTRSHLDWN